MREREIPPVGIAAIIVVVVALLGFFGYRAAMPPAPTVPIPAAGLSGPDPRNPARPPVDEHANDWHPSKAPAAATAGR
jgi:hypothetical protein